MTQDAEQGNLKIERNQVEWRPAPSKGMGSWMLATVVAFHTLTAYHC